MSNGQEPAVFSITIDQIQDYEFRVAFDKAQYADLMVDEPPPIGRDSAPNPSRLLAAAVGNCLCASYLFSARKVRANLLGIHATVALWNHRNDQGRLRIGRIQVEIKPKFESGTDPGKIERCRSIFEDYCVVTESVRGGIETAVKVQTEIACP
jgi:uncharacterized OsmC-like protein